MALCDHTNLTKKLSLSLSDKIMWELSQKCREIIQWTMSEEESSQTTRLIIVGEVDKTVFKDSLRNKLQKKLPGKFQDQLAETRDSWGFQASNLLEGTAERWRMSVQAAEMSKEKWGWAEREWTQEIGPVKGDKEWRRLAIAANKSSREWEHWLTRRNSSRSSKGTLIFQLSMESNSPTSNTTIRDHHRGKEISVGTSQSN